MVNFEQVNAGWEPWQVSKMKVFTNIVNGVPLWYEMKFFEKVSHNLILAVENAMYIRLVFPFYIHCKDRKFAIVSWAIKANIDLKWFKFDSQNFFFSQMI